MITDLITRAELYTGLGQKIEKGLKYLQNTDLMAMEPGRHDIQDEEIYAMLQTYETKPRDEGTWEAHRRYIDIQYIADGTEMIGYAPVDFLNVTTPYSSERDVAFYSGGGDMLTARKGVFFIFFPEDAHMPGISCESPASVRKVVVKITAE